MGGSNLFKLYDGILNTRFTLWFKPCTEQTGAQKHRGCVEQILTLRLLMDTARKKKLRLYIAFLDYVKAYDSMNRNKLLSMLAAKGCSNVFLQAIGKTISNTISCLGEEEVRATAGVRQGGSTGCSLFMNSMKLVIPLH